MTMDSETRKMLLDHFGKTVRFNESMAKYTSLRVGGPAKIYSQPDSFETLIRMIQWSKEHQLPYIIIGSGTNLLIKDGGYAGVMISLKRCLKGISQIKKPNGPVLVSAMAGTLMKELCKYAIEQGLAGMNFALGIPGTVGGGIVMNAGTSYGWVEDVIDHITVLHTTGKTEEIERKHLRFGYRSLSRENGKNTLEPDQVVISGCFSLSPANYRELRQQAQRILKERREKQPVDEWSAGCFFKNPAFGKSAGELIEMAGLKGKQIGGAAVSEKHANFLINRGNASAKDFLELMALVQDRVSTLFHVDLETEVKIVGS